MNAVQRHNLFADNKDCHEFRFSIVRIVISVSNVTIPRTVFIAVVVFLLWTLNTLSIIVTIVIIINDYCLIWDSLLSPVSVVFVIVFELFWTAKKKLKNKQLRFKHVWDSDTAQIGHSDPIKVPKKCDTSANC